MGARFNSTSSHRLEVVIRQLEKQSTSEVAKFADLVSSDNDDYTGQEILDRGIGLALACRDYDKHAIIFFAYGDRRDGNQTCYYVFGKDEDDALRRFTLSQTLPHSPAESPAGEIR